MERTIWQRVLGSLREPNVRFRHKVMFGVGLALVIAIVSGSNAVYNVRKVEASVNFSVVAASPLLIGVISLSESYQKLQGIFDPVMKNCAGLEGAGRYLEQSASKQKTMLASLKKLAMQADAATELGRYEFSGKKIFRTRKELLDVCLKATKFRSDIAIATGTMRAKTNTMAIEAAMNIISLENKHGLKTGSALQGQTNESSGLDKAQLLQAWIRLRSLYRQRILITEISSIGSTLGATERRFELERIHRGFRIKLQALEQNILSLKPFYQENGRLSDYVALRKTFVETASIVDRSPRSVFASMASVLDIDRAKQSLVVRLQREQGQYSVALLNIMDVAQRINRNAQHRTAEEANLARLEIGVGVLASACLALLIGWFFKRAVTTPLETLTGNVSAIGLAIPAGSDPVDPALRRRRDEIGDLAKQFSTAFNALASARRELQETSRAEIALQRDRLYGAIENMPQGLYMLDGEGCIIVANRKLSELYNFDGDVEFPGLRVEEFEAMCKHRGAGVKRVVSDRLLSDVDTNAGSYQTSQRIVQLDDERVMTMTVMSLPDGGYVVTHEDITQKQAASEKIAHMAMHDSLTNLANRTLFREHIASHSGKEQPEGGALLLLDLDRFKIVNDTLGHPVGDALLVKVAERLRGCIGANCFPARLGGDEFAIFQSGAAQPEGAAALAAEIIDQIARPFDVNGHHIVIGTSVGIATMPDHGHDADELSRNADMALYCAKQERRGEFRFFEADMDRRMRDWHAMERDLRVAITQQQFTLHYQPLVNLETEQILGFEALVRWEHPVRGTVSPAEFIPVAEEAGLITELGEWILETACAEAVSWPDDISISVNISPLQFGSGKLPETVRTALQRTRLQPARLMLEITEGVFLNDTAQTLEALEEIRAFGVHIAMDDFGTGYSSLSYIRKFPFSKIKIDQSFVRGLNDNSESLAIVRAVINLCHDLGMGTTAEGVETRAQAEALRGLGCLMAQGYLFGKPMPAANARRLFDRDRKKFA